MKVADGSRQIQTTARSDWRQTLCRDLQQRQVLIQGLKLHRKILRVGRNNLRALHFAPHALFGIALQSKDYFIT